MPSNTSNMHSKAKVVVITGASAGLGENIALQLASEPDKYCLALIARSSDKLAAVAAKCGDDNTLAVTADMTKRSEVKESVKKIVAKFDRIDVWINNAGRGSWVAPSEMTDETVIDMTSVNVLSAVHGMQEALPVFKAQRYGHFINVSSLLGRAAHLMPQYGAYSGSKYFLNGMTDAFRAEVANDYPNIKFTTASPGGIATDFGNVAKGPDMRTLPGTQDVEDVARAIIDKGIVAGAQEVYMLEAHEDLMRNHLSTLVPPATGHNSHKAFGIRPRLPRFLAPTRKGKSIAA